MKNYDILALATGGALNITDHDIPTGHAIKVYHFRRSLKALFNKLIEDEKALIEQCGLTVDNGKIEGKEDDIKRFAELQKELYNEDAAIDCKAMPYEVWHVLKAENKAVDVNGRKVDVLSAFEGILEGVLWVEDVEKE